MEPANNPLEALAVQYSTDKRLAQHGYTRWYHEILGPIRADVTRLLEMGVWAGGSLRMWEDYFTNAEIVGLDPLPACQAHKGGRRAIFLGRQEDAATCDRIRERYPSGFDVIVDDAGHFPAQQIRALTLYFSLVKPGGYYFIEDLHTAYWPAFTAAGSPSIMEYLKRALDDLNRHGKQKHANQPVTQSDSASLNEWERHIQSIQFFRSLSVIKKAGSAGSV